VLVPVLDEEKHYWIGDDEMAKLLPPRRGWLAAHPEREAIARRYLRHRSLVRDALAHSLTPEELERENRPADLPQPSPEEPLEGSEATASREDRKVPLRELRLLAVRDALREAGARRVLDLGCGEGALLRLLLSEPAFTEIVGLDVSHRALEVAGQRLGLERMSEAKRRRLRPAARLADPAATAGSRASTPPPWSRSSSTSTHPASRLSRRSSSVGPGRGPSS
jgi:hypothetical protein